MECSRLPWRSYSQSEWKISNGGVLLRDRGVWGVFIEVNIGTCTYLSDGVAENVV